MSNQELLIVRGLPGAGKSTFAARLADCLRPQFFTHIETDMYFMRGGSYKFIPEQLAVAHTWAQRWCRDELTDGDSVIISNTFSRVWEMQPYIDMAKEFSAKLTVIEVQGDHGNIHNVPEESINKMKARWERYP